MRAAYIDAVLEVVSLVPAAKVLSYGDVAALLETGGPRQVGSVMSHYGSDVPWWRVIRSDGSPPSGLGGQALENYRQESTPLRGSTSGEGKSWRVDMKTARWNPSDAEFDAIDAIAAWLAEALAGGGAAAAGAPMSAPRDGVEA